MKNKLKKIIFLLIMVMGILLISAGTSLGFAVNQGGGEPVDDPYNVYCRFHPKCYRPHLGSLSGPYATKMTYSATNTSTTGPFGYYLRCLGITGSNNMTLQRYIWGSGDPALVDSGSGGGSTHKRYSDYVSALGIIKTDEKSLFTLNPKDSSQVKLSIDQRTGEYILGPYSLRLTSDSYYNHSTTDDINYADVNKIISMYLNSTINEYVSEILKDVIIENEKWDYTDEPDQGADESGQNQESEEDEPLTATGPQMELSDGRIIILSDYEIIEEDGKKIIVVDDETKIELTEEMIADIEDYKNYNQNTEDDDIENNNEPNENNAGEKTRRSLEELINSAQDMKENETENRISYTFEGNSEIEGLLSLIKVARFFSNNFETTSVTTSYKLVLDGNKYKEVENKTTSLNKSSTIYIEYLIDLIDKLDKNVEQYKIVSTPFANVQGLKNFLNRLTKTKNSNNNSTIKSDTYEILQKLYSGNLNKVKINFKVVSSTFENGMFITQDNKTITIYVPEFDKSADIHRLNDIKATINGLYTEGAEKYSTSKAVEILYKEIIGSIELQKGEGISLGNSGQDKRNTFANFLGVYGLDATEYSIDADLDGTKESIPEVKFINEDGKEIPFPDFRSTNNKFYLRYKPKQGNLKETAGVNGGKDGIISHQTGKPSIKVALLKEVGTTAASRYISQTAVWENLNYKKLLSMPGVKATVVGLKYNPSNPFTKYPHNSSTTKDVTVTATVKFSATTYGGEGVAGKAEGQVEVELKLTATRHSRKPVTTGVYEMKDGKRTRTGTKIVGYNYYQFTTNKNLLDPKLYTPTGSIKMTQNGGLQNLTKTPTISIPSVKLSAEETRFWSEFHVDIKGGWVIAPADGVGKSINVKIGGKVWIEGDAAKGSSMASPGRLSDNNGADVEGDEPFIGLEVELYEEINLFSEDGNITNANQFKFKARTKTKGIDNNKYAEYSFGHLNPLKKYYVRFLYNGMLYQPTYYKYNLQNNLPGPKDYSNAQEIEQERIDFNKRFKTINSTTFGNYYRPNGTLNTAYGEDTKLRTDDGGISDITFGDVWKYYRELLEKHNDAYTDTLVKDNSGLDNYLKGHNIHPDDRRKILNYIDDCMIRSQTLYKSPIQKGTTGYNQYDYIGNNEPISYPVYDRFTVEELEFNNQGEGMQEADGSVIVFKNYRNGGENVNFMDLYSHYSDQSRAVSFGLSPRIKTDIALQKDVYKVSMIVNGKLEEYIYNKKTNDNNDINDNTWEVPYRQGDSLYTGLQSDENGKKIPYTYNREVRPSEYLYASETNTQVQTNKRDLQAYVTYRITVANTGQTTIGNDLEIVDYYDSEQFTIDTENGNADGDLKRRKISNADGTVSSEEYFTSYSTDLRGTIIDGKEYNGVMAQNKTSDPNLIIKNTSSLGEKKDANDGRNKLQLMDENGKYKYDYDNLYLSGFNKILEPGRRFSIYLTFKVNTNPVSGKIRLDEGINNGSADATINAIDNFDIYKVGKRNIAEVYKYSTTYSSDYEIPDYLDNVPKNKKVSGENVSPDLNIAGIVDKNSKPGSITDRDIDKTKDRYGRLINEYKENDEDISVNLKFVIETPNPGQTTDTTRKIQGRTFEDMRTKTAGQAAVGDGVYNSNDKDELVNGVTVELIELVTEIDDEGISTGKYIKEYQWGTFDFEEIQIQAVDSGIGDGNQVTVAVLPELENAIRYARYSSGTEHAKVIINGPQNTKLHININDDENIKEYGYNQGEYGFYSIVAGDYFVRFHYGDHQDTLLTNDPRNEVYKLFERYLPEDELAEYVGRNTKSYNGQDFKSTVYQRGIDQTKSPYYPGSVNNGSNQIDGFLRSELNSEITDINDLQNYRNYAEDPYNENIPDENSNIKDAEGNPIKFDQNTRAMYTYNIALSEPKPGVSDAKDVYKYRERANGYASILTNHNSEVLDSFEKIATTDYPIFYKYKYKKNEGEEAIEWPGKDRETTEYIKYIEDSTIENLKDLVTEVTVRIPESQDKPNANVTALLERQKALIKELKGATEQTAQSGIIDTNIEKNRSVTENLSAEARVYNLNGIDFGITERPKTQLLLNKEVDNLKFTLTNGSILFNTQGPATDLIFTKHSSNSAKYSESAEVKLESVRRTLNKKLFPEIIQGYVDEQVLNGANIEITYKFTVKNVSEVDYLGTKFYYYGIIDNPKDQDQVAKTKADLVIDYISQDLKYTEQKQLDPSVWTSRSKEELVAYRPLEHEGVSEEDSLKEEKNNLINAVYFDELASYGDSNLSYMVTNKLSGDNEFGLLPEVFTKENDGQSSSGPVHMVLTTSTSFYDSNSIYTYNNLSEIIRISNQQGRRMQYSIVGNQPMADQETKNNAKSEEDNKNYSKVQLVTPSEVDADSAQQITFLPPTGENKNYTLVTFISVAAASIVAVGYIIIRRSLMAKQKA